MSLLSLPLFKYSAFFTFPEKKEFTGIRGKLLF
jgi:hypothetical protein